MTVEENQEIENTEVENFVETDDVPVDGNVDADGNVDVDGNVKQEGDTPPAYEADYNYKVYDEQKEIPEFYRSLITDKESEDQVRKLFCKADGIDGIKMKYDKTKIDRDSAYIERDEYKSKFTDLNSNVDAIKYYKENDLGALFKHIGLTKDQIFGWTEDQIDMDNTPGKKASYEQQSQRTQETWQQQQETAQQRQHTEQMFQQQHELALHNVMMQPDIQSVSNKVDSIFGEGTFAKEVESHGQMVTTSSGKYVFPDEAAKHIQGKYEAIFNQFNAQQPGTDTGAGSHGAPEFTPPAPKSAPAQRTAAVAPPPNLGSGAGTSPTAKQPSSVADLRKIYENMEN